MTLRLAVPQLLQAGLGGLQIPLPTCSWLWVPELEDSHLHPSPRQLWQVAAEAADTTLLHCLVLLHSYRISWEGTTRDLPLRRVFVNLRCEVSEGLHVSTPNMTNHVLTSAPSSHCFLPFFSLAPCKLATVVYGWGLCMAVLTSLSALKKYKDQFCMWYKHASGCNLAVLVLMCFFLC